MEDPIEKANHRISELRKEITAKLRQVKELEAKNGALQAAVDERDKSLRSLHEEMAVEEKRRKEGEEERWAEYHGMMAKLREEQKALDEQRAKLEAARAKQLKELSDSRQLVEQWQMAVDNVRRENDAVQQLNVTQLHDYQQRFITLQQLQAQSKKEYSEQIFALQAALTRHAEQLHSHEDVIERQALSVKQLEAQLMSERAEKDAQYRAYRERVDELGRRQEEKVKELTTQYLQLTSESEAIISGIKAEIDFRGEKLDVLSKWELQRERIEGENATLKSNLAKLHKQAEVERKERLKAEREVEREMKALRDSVIVLQSDKELLSKELSTKKAALKVYKDEFEVKQKQRIEQEEKDKVKQAQDRDKSNKGGLLMSLFGSKRKEDGDVNGTPQGKTVHPSAMHSAADKGFLDLEEEMAVALTERVEKLSLEKGRLEDELLIAQRQLEQEKITAAQLRQQLKAEGKPSDDPASRAQSKKDKLVLSPENTAKVLSETIARNRELEELKREQEKELKRVKQQLEVKRGELKEAMRGAGRPGSATPSKTRSNSTLTTTQPHSTTTSGTQLAPADTARPPTVAAKNGDTDATNS